MKFKAISYLLLLLLLGCFGSFERSEAQAKFFDYQVTQLDNGLDIVTLEDHSSPIAAVHLWYHVGSKNEKPNRRGFAHMFEHMMFRGTDRLDSKGHFNYISGVGGTNNAYTAFDNTTYIQTVPSNQVEMVMWLESERMGFLNINDEHFKTERKVVAEELRKQMEQPYAQIIMEKILPQIMQGTPYLWTPGGSIEELEQSTSQELQDFWNTYYIPNNATLVVVGDVTHDNIVALAEKYFGWIPRYPDPPPVVVPEYNQTQSVKITEKEGRAPVPLAARVYRTVPVGHEDELALEVLSSICGEGESGRLYRTMVTEHEVAQVAGSMSHSMQMGGLFACFAVMSPLGSDHEKVQKAFADELEKIKQEGVLEDELTKARNNALRDVVSGLLSIEGKASILGNAAVIAGDLEGLNTYVDRVRKITSEDIKRVAQKYFVPEREYVINIETSMLGFLSAGGSHQNKKTQQTKKEPVEPFEGHGKPNLKRPQTLADQPPVQPLLKPRIEFDAHETYLKNGIKVVVIENHEVPFVTMTCGFFSGATTEPQELPGTASMAMGMLTRGTTQYSYKELTNLLERHAISISGAASMGTSAVGMSCVVDHLDLATKMFAHVIRESVFPEAELTTLATQTQTGLVVAENTPDYLVEREFKRRLYHHHPYSRNVSGESKDLSRLRSKHLNQWWQKHARPDNAVLYIAGDISSQNAFKLAREYFEDWQVEKQAELVQLPKVSQPKEKHIYLIERSGQQAQIRMGHLGVTRPDPHYPAVTVFNQLFGGSFGSRLNEAVRIKAGLTYGARGGFSAGRFLGQFSISTFSKNQTVGQTIELVLSELKRLKTEPPSKEEIEKAKKYVTGSFIRSIETPMQIVSQQWLAESLGFSSRYWSNLLKKIELVDESDIKAVVDNLIFIDQLVIVVVGDPSIKEQLEKIAPVTVVKPGAAVSG